MPIAREIVISAFKRHLGRLPESEKTILTHMSLPNEDHLFKTLTSSNEFLVKKLKTGPNNDHIKKRILLIGNCQFTGIANLINSMSPDTHAAAIELTPIYLKNIKQKVFDLRLLIENCDIAILQHLPSEPLHQFLVTTYPLLKQKIRLCPAISFTAFHPDLGYVKSPTGAHLVGEMGEYHSMLAFWAWKNDKTPDEALELFNSSVYKHLGYYNHLSTSKDFLLDRGRLSDLPLSEMMDEWLKKGCFMHSINHPKIFVLADIARALLDREQVHYLPEVENYLHDPLSLHPCWPIYPDIGTKLSLSGHYTFKKISTSPQNLSKIETVDLKDFITKSFQVYSNYPKADLSSFRLDNEVFTSLGAFISNGRDAHLVKGNSRRSNPYLGLPKYQYWRKSIELQALNDVDPVAHSNFKLLRTDKIATAGSCFAQHISRTLSSNGFTYYIAEKNEDNTISSEEAKSKNYGVFSARYGNIYTPRQLLQLLLRALGKLSPIDKAWAREDGKYVDPFRPQIEPNGYDSISELESSKELHLSKVREMFHTADVFIFTLGLTECWRNIADGAVFPIAPGVISKNTNPSDYEFVNFETHEITSDIQKFLSLMQDINPKCRVILTVSPVPLVATYENRHVLTSSTYSKSALRAAADYIVRRNSHCEYFPSYEIITGNYTKSSYYEEDLRSVRPEGVSHVMRLFMRHYSVEHVSTEPNSTFKDAETAADTRVQEALKINDIICEEELLDPNLGNNH